MIIQKTIEVTNSPRMRSYWKSKNYDVSKNKITVKVEDLKPNSNVLVECICDECSRKYQQRYGRDCNICGACHSSKRMRGNNLGTLSKKYHISKDDLMNCIEKGYGKSHIADKHGVTISVVNRWLKEHNINLSPYYGRKFFKNLKDEEIAILSIEEALKQTNEGLSAISKITGIPTHIIRALKLQGKIEVPTMFSKWKDQYHEILNNFDFYKNENITKTLKTIADENNISVEHLKKVFKEKNENVILHSYNKSKGELEVKDFIRNELGMNCVSSMFEKTYEIDCYVPSKKFGVEYCGEFWHQTTTKKNNKFYHRNKMEFVKSRGITIMTIFESEWIHKQDIIKSMIRTKLGFSERIMARQCKIAEISKKEAEDFHLKSHLSGYTNSSVNIGLFKNDELVSVLSFIKSRFDKKYEYEISRFSSKLNTVVVGGLSRLFKFFCRKYKPSSIMTYVDLRVGQGSSYEKIGFKFEKNTVPNYWYFDPSKGELESRMKYQKNKIKTFQNYTPSSTEFEIMEGAGYYRIYDCGNRKFSWVSN